MASAELPHLPSDDEQISKILMDRLHLHLTANLFLTKLRKVLPRFYHSSTNGFQSLMITTGNFSLAIDVVQARS